MGRTDRYRSSVGRDHRAPRLWAFGLRTRPLSRHSTPGRRPRQVHRMKRCALPSLRPARLADLPSSLRADTPRQLCGCRSIPFIEQPETRFVPPSGGEGFGCSTLSIACVPSQVVLPHFWGILCAIRCVANESPAQRIAKSGRDPVVIIGFPHSDRDSAALVNVALDVSHPKPSPFHRCSR
jgi:hypothetical protein